MDSYIISNWQVMIIIITLAAAARYFFVAGGAYFIFYKKGLHYFRKFKIQYRLPQTKQVKYELLLSVSTLIIFSAVGTTAYFLFRSGHTKIYLDVTEHGWLYFICSILAMIMAQDIYFYFTHRLLHTRWMLRNFHYVHHKSTNPTPLAAYCFHPVEAIVESLVVFPFIMIMPVHYAAVLIFTFFVLFLNVFGHLGFEFIPLRFRYTALGKLFTSPTHHNLHHQNANKNFGYTFTFLDNVLKTLDKKTYL